MDDQIVSNGSEVNTEPAPSQSADIDAGYESTQTPSSGQETIDDSSREDINTPSVDNTSDDLVQQAQNVVKTPESVNRVQELANRVKEQQAYIDRMQQTAGQYQQPGQQAYEADIATQVASLQARQQLQDAKFAIQQDNQLFSEAQRKHPELDPKSDHYDRDFDDTVFDTVKSATLRGENLTYEQAASRLKRLMGKTESKAYAKAEQDIGIKSVNNSQPIKSASAARGEAEPQEDAMKRYKSGDKNAIFELLDY